MELVDATLLSRLRSGTRRAQGALEVALARLRISEVAGLALLLGAERDALATMVAADPAMAPLLAPAQALLCDDLAELGVTGSATARIPPAFDDALARGYVWHSSRLWLRMTSRVLPKGGPGQRYLRQPRDIEGWRALCAELEAAPGIGAQAERCVSAANDWFALCESICYDHARR